ncbi:aspartoacylase isoform X1 [Stigmatopora argus]
MFEAHDDFSATQVDDGVDVFSTAKPFHVEEKSSPDYVKKTSQHLECSAGQSSQIPTSEDVLVIDSDSGDSLFLTQVPVTQPARSLTPPSSPRYIYETEWEEAERDTSSHSHDGHHHKPIRKKRARETKLPKYSFLFLEGTTSKPRCTHLSNEKNRKFHNYVMGGFFKCLELAEGADDLWACLPTVDQDNEDISPLTEDEDDTHDEDIQVVGNKCFVVKSKPKCKQLWYKQQISTEVPKSSGPFMKNKKNKPPCSSALPNNHTETLGGKVLPIQTPPGKDALFVEETKELVDAESTSERVPFKHLDEDGDGRSVLEEGEDDNNDGPQVLQTHENRIGNFENVDIILRPDSKEEEVVSLKKKKKKKRSKQHVNSDFGGSEMDDSTWSLSQSELGDEVQVQEFSCDERPKKKKKKKRSNEDSGTLDMIAESQRTAKKKAKKFCDATQEQGDISEGSSGCAKLSRGNIEKDKMSFNIFEELGMLATPQLIKSKKKKKKISSGAIPEDDDTM